MANFDYIANPELNGNALKSYMSALETRGNPNSTHGMGQKVHSIYEVAHQKVKQLIPGYIHVEFVPGGGSVANRRAILGSVPTKPKFLEKEVRRDIVIISSIEHRSIEIETANLLLDRGYTVIRTPVTPEGVLDVEQFENTLKEHSSRVALVSVMWANNEIGTIQPIEQIGKLITKNCPHAVFHSDVGQGVGLFKPVPDVATLSLYKLGGFHIGLVLSRSKLQEEYLWTPDVAMIVGSVTALEEYIKNFPNFVEETDIMRKAVKVTLENIFRTQNVEFVKLGQDGLSNVISYLLPFQASKVQQMLSEQGVYVGTGSACASRDNKGSHVVSALGYTNVNNLLRVSFGLEVKNKLRELLFAFKNIIPELDKLTTDKLIRANRSGKIQEGVENSPKIMRLDTPLDIQLATPSYQYIKLSISEAYLKGQNRDFFMKVLVHNIERVVENKILKKGLMLLVPCSTGHVELIEKIQNVSGISKIVPVVCVLNTQEAVRCIASIINKKLKEGKLKFKIDAKVKTSKSKKYNSVDWNRLFGQYVMDRFQDRVEVNLNNPEIAVGVEIYSKQIFVSYESYRGMEGLPVGTESYLTCLVDTNNYLRSILACYMMSQRGVKIDLMIQEIQRDYPEVQWVIQMVSKYQPDMQIVYMDEQYELPDRNVIFEADPNGSRIKILRRLKKFMEESGFLVVNCTIMMSDDEVLIRLSQIGFAVETEYPGINEIENGKVLSLLSGGIDSPVASHMVMNVGMEVDYIHFATNLDKIDNILQIREKLGNMGKIIVVDFKPIQELIVDQCPESYRTIMYKVYMIVIANKYGLKDGYDGIVTGNSWGQVASQTPENLRVCEMCSDLPIISPLIGFCKGDIINLARQIGTYEPSICDGTDDCCVMYLPKHPVLKADLGKVGEYTRRVGLGLIDKLNIRIIEALPMAMTL